MCRLSFPHSIVSTTFISVKNFPRRKISNIAPPLRASRDELFFSTHLPNGFRYAAAITSNAGLVTDRELDEALGLTATASDLFRDRRHGKNTPTIGGFPRFTDGWGIAGRFSAVGHPERSTGRRILEDEDRASPRPRHHAPPPRPPTEINRIIILKPFLTLASCHSWLSLMLY